MAQNHKRSKVEEMSRFASYMGPAAECDQRLFLRAPGVLARRLRLGSDLPLDLADPGERHQARRRGHLEFLEQPPGLRWEGRRPKQAAGKLGGVNPVENQLSLGPRHLSPHFHEARQQKGELSETDVGADPTRGVVPRRPQLEKNSGVSGSTFSTCRPRNRST